MHFGSTLSHITHLHSPPLILSLWRKPGWNQYLFWVSSPVNSLSTCDYMHLCISTTMMSMCHWNIGLLIDPHWVEAHSLVSGHLSNTFRDYKDDIPLMWENHNQKEYFRSENIHAWRILLPTLLFLLVSTFDMRINLGCGGPSPTRNPLWEQH